MTENEITGQVVDAAYKIHTKLGPGLFETVYETLLAYELEKRGLRIKRQQAVPLVYETIHFARGFRVDLLVEDKVIIEVKSVETLHPVFRKQLLTYLRLADKRVGLLINFGAMLIKEGIFRVVNNLNQ